MTEIKSLKISTLILAAGNSIRMGQPKQLLPWKHTNLIRHTITKAHYFSEQFVVVLGANAEKMQPHVPKDKWTINKEWQKGMGSSLSHGVDYLEKKYTPMAILVMVVDQPLLKLAHYKSLIAMHQKHPDKICSSNYKERPGVPAIFPQSFFKELKGLGADMGARKLMQLHRDAVVLVKTKGELMDLDTPEDYRSAFLRLGE